MVPRSDTVSGKGTTEFSIPSTSSGLCVSRGKRSRGMRAKHWESRAVELLQGSLRPIAHEINELDWKAGLSPLRERLTEHLMAYANYPGGGFMVFGIDNANAQPFGVTQEQVAAITNTLANLGRDAVEPALAVDHGVIELDGVPLLCVHIPEHKNRPVHRRGKSIEECWVRSAGTTRKASRQEVAGLMLGSQPPRWEELRASPVLDADATIAALDLTTIAKLRERPLPEDRQALLRWLADERMITLEGSGYCITHFGAVAAARRLEDFDSLTRKRIRVIRYHGTNKVDTIDELVGQRGYAVGFEGLIGHLKRSLPHSEVIQQALRAEVNVYPEIALRELIANTLIHQDFGVTGAGPMIEIFADRIEFTNPGGLLPSKRLDRLIGTTPESRNEVLASAFRLYRICEERGTGFQKVVAAIELFGLPPVAFAALDGAFRVTLYAPRKFADMGKSERVEACYQHAVLRFLSGTALTNTSLRGRLKLNEKQRNTVTNLIGDAVEAGRIKRKDQDSGNKFAEYLPYWA